MSVPHHYVLSYRDDYDGRYKACCQVDRWYVRQMPGFTSKLWMAFYDRINQEDPTYEQVVHFGWCNATTPAEV